MRQGIIFGIIITILSFTSVYFIIGSGDTTNLDIIIMQDGEEIYSTPLLYSDQVEIIWYVHEDKERLVLKNQEIIDYYNLDISIEQLANIENIDYRKIIAKSGSTAEVNMLINSNGNVYVYEANCPDKIDVKIGKINNTSKIITCAPHKLVIKLRSNQKQAKEELDGQVT